MGKIMPKIVKTEISDEVPFFVVGVSFEGAKPSVNAIFGEMRASLRGEHIGTGGITPTVLKIVMERTTRFIQQINIAKLFSFVPNMKPANLRTDMGVLNE